MLRSTFVLFAASLAVAPVAFAAPPATPVAVNQADIEATAQKMCNDALDHDRFDYSTMEECVADKAAKLQHAQTAPHGKGGSLN
jgi:predicted lipoprotein with Yx(FWY)xxD motif